MHEIGSEARGSRMTVVEGTAWEHDVKARLIARDPDALTEMYDQFGSYVFGLAARVIGDRRAAEDVTQDVFLSMWERPEAMERYIAAHRESAAEVERLREVAAGLGAAGASSPPVTVRERLLHAAADRVTPLAADIALQSETDRFDSFLSTLVERDLEVLTHNGLTVRELVQHVEAIDRAFVEAADDPTTAYIGAHEVEVVTARELSERVAEPFAETVTRFRRTRRRLVGLHERLAADRRVAGYERDDTLVIRAFETWTHHDDVRHALGRNAAPPDAEVMRTMAELAMKALPLALAARGSARPGHTARVVLEGPGGGEWTLACAPGESAALEPDVVVRASVVDWCRRFADRLEPDDVMASVNGDAGLARDLVAAANAFAGL